MTGQKLRFRQPVLFRSAKWAKSPIGLARPIGSREQGRRLVAISLLCSFCGNIPPNSPSCRVFMPGFPDKRALPRRTGGGAPVLSMFPSAMRTLRPDMGNIAKPLISSHPGIGSRLSREAYRRLTEKSGPRNPDVKSVVSLMRYEICCP